MRSVEYHTAIIRFNIIYPVLPLVRHVDPEPIKKACPEMSRLFCFVMAKFQKEDASMCEYLLVLSLDVYG